LGDRLAVRRIRAEAMWGLTRAHGFFGDLEAAQRAAHEGVETGQWAGDPWVTALTELTLGASHVLAGKLEDGLEILLRVLMAFRDCGDSLGRAVARLWLSLAYLALGQSERLAACLEDLMTLGETCGYDFLFTTRTLLGPPDARRIVPLLVAARDRRTRPAYAIRLLTEIGLRDIKVHPGYQLRLQTLGAFRAWRGDVEIEPREWQRDKARQLFQLLIVERGRWLQRDEIVETLWPQLAPEAAARDFKVALNAVNRALEPQRATNAPFAFIIREGAAYRLRPEADAWLDSAAFEQASEAGLRHAADRPEQALGDLRFALDLYRGDYLPDALYEDWTSAERERLLALYLRAADKLASLLVERGQLDACLETCQAILARDACWENAYRLMMTAYARQGYRAQAVRAYQRCIDTLRAELGVPPSPATVALHEQLAGPATSV
jgi:DNA-binding SARP family transcriptional activator